MVLYGMSLSSLIETCSLRLIYLFAYKMHFIFIDSLKRLVLAIKAILSGAMSIFSSIGNPTSAK
jgi:hypothetical protein